MSSLSAAIDPPEEVLSRETRRLTAKCVLEHQKTKDAHQRAKDAEDNIERLEPLASLVPGLQKEISDLKLELNATVLRLHEATANLRSSRKKQLEAEFAAGRALVEAEQRLLACGEDAAAAAEAVAKELKDATDELMEVKQQLSAAETKSSSALQHAEKMMAQVENKKSVAFEEVEKKLTLANEKSAAALQDAEKKLADAEANHRASLLAADLKLAEVETKCSTACREAEQKLADSEAEKGFAIQKAEKKLAAAEAKSHIALQKVEKRLADAEKKNASALQTVEKKLAAAEMKSSTALQDTENKLKDAEAIFSSALRRAEQKVEDAESRGYAVLQKTEKALLDAVEESPFATQEVRKKLAELGAGSLAALHKAEKKAEEAQNQRDETIAKTNLLVADLMAKVAAAEEDVRTWKQSSIDCDRKLAIAVEKLNGSAGVVTAMGNTFSPAPLGSTVLGHPADRHQVRDVASESRSRFTLNLPFEIDRSEPLSTQPLEDCLDEAPIPRSKMPRKRRRVDLQEVLRAKDSHRAGAKRPRRTARNTSLKSGENVDAESSQSVEVYPRDEESAHAETETESVDRRRVTAGSFAHLDGSDGDEESGVITGGKVTGQNQTGTVRRENTGRVRTGSQRQAIQKTVKSKEKERLMNALVKDGRAASGKEGGAGASIARGVRKAVPRKRAGRSSKSGTSKTTPVSESPVNSQLQSRPQNLTRGRPARRRNQVSYDYSVGTGRDVCKDMLR